MKNKNNVKATVKFTCEQDVNLELFNLKAQVSYHLPEEFGFTKRKEFDIVLIQDKEFVAWMKEVKHLMVGTRVKSIIYNEIKEHLMERLRKSYDSNPDVVGNILNMFNQMKFEFHFDIEEAEKTITSIKEIEKEFF